MYIKKVIPMCMLALAPLSVKAQSAVHFIPEAGICGTAKTVPMLLGGCNAAYSCGKNFADVFIGGSLNKDAVPGFVGIAVENYSWNKNISSWIRDLFMSSKTGVTSTLDVAPAKFNTSIGKFDFSVLPAYCRQDDMVNHTACHSFKGIIQSIFHMTPKDQIMLEMQYGTTPANSITNTSVAPFSDTFNFTATYSRTF